MALAVRDQTDQPTRWDPLGDMQRLQTQFGRILEGMDLPLAAEGFVPLADVEETEDAYLVELELPGVDKKDIDISLSGRRLTVTGERKEKERVGVLRRRTRSVGQFNYEIVLPEAVEGDDISASLNDGVLVLRIPKATAQRARHIEVK
ncbi:MAG: heat shock protein Hsp20 [Acidimicrobiales bacterium]|nr:heat shock protein Hsp20 [Acidimicrobiales bacterium]